MRKLILRNFQSPGDVVMLTAAVRDLHRCHPGEFLTDVRTSCPDLWRHNPHLTPLSEDDPEVRVWKGRNPAYADVRGSFDTAVAAGVLDAYAEAARRAPNLPERDHLTRQAARLNCDPQG